MRRWRSGWLVLALLALLAPATAQSAQRAETVRSIVVTAKPIFIFDPRHRSQQQFGALWFLGGLALTANDKAFGGFSELHVDADGRHFVSASDRSNWLRGVIRYDGTRPAGIVQAQMAPMLAWDGKTLKQHGWFDTESLTADGGTFYVGIERVNRIVRFDFGTSALKARAHNVPVPPAIRKLPYNLGLESLIHVPKGQPLGGTLLAFAERGLDAAGNHTAFLIGGPHPGTFHIRRHDKFDISDATLLPGGTVLLLERRFVLPEGIGIRICRLSLKDIKPGALLDPPVIFTADAADQVDNMEGISAFRRNGATVLTLISDDNFSPLQRTLLLQFELVGK